MAQQANEAAAADKARTVVYLGNRKTVVVREDGEREPYDGKRCTTVRLRPDASLLEALTEIAGPNGVWASHSDADAPAWVAAEGPLAAGLVALLEAQYPGIEVRDPEPAEDLPGGDG